jgi:hypothetical protein
MTVGAEIILGWAPSLLSLLVAIVIMKPSSSGRCSLVSRAAAAMSMISFLVQVPTPVESDFIWEVSVNLVVLLSLLLVKVVVARTSFIMSDLIESLFKQRPIQMRAMKVALGVLLKGHILGWVEDPKLLVSLALWSLSIVSIVEDLNQMVCSGKIRCWLSGQSLRAHSIVLHVWLKMTITVLVESLRVARENLRSRAILILSPLKICIACLILITTIWNLVRHIWTLEIVKSLLRLSLKWIFLFDLRMSVSPLSVSKIGVVLSEIRN